MRSYIAAARQYTHEGYVTLIARPNHLAVGFLTLTTLSQRVVRERKMQAVPLKTVDSYTRPWHSLHMRTNIVIDDKLMADALSATGLGTKRAVVEAGLRTLVSIRRQTGLRRLRGKLRWTGNLEEMRRARIDRT